MLGGRCWMLGTGYWMLELTCIRHKAHGLLLRVVVFGISVEILYRKYSGSDAQMLSLTPEH